MAERRWTVDPRSRWGRVAIPLLLALLAMLGPFSIDTPFPAFAQMQQSFGVDSVQMQLVVTTYLGAFAVMSIFHGPLSDAAGRKPVLLWSTAIYIAASIGASVSPNLTILLVFRCLQGMSAGGAAIVSRTVIRDLYSGPEAQVLMSRVAMVFALGPAIAPIVGGLLLQLGSWQLVFGFMATFGLVLFAATAATLPESHPTERRVPLRPNAVLGGLLLVARRPAFFRLTGAATLAFAGQFLYIGGAAIFVVDLLGGGELDFWVLFVPMVTSMLVGAWISARAAGRITARLLVSLGYAVSLLGAVLAVGLAAVGLGDVLPWAVMGLAVIALGNGMSYPSMQLMLLDLFPDHRGAVMSATTFISLTFNALTAVALTPLVGGSALGFAITALVMLGCGHVFWTWHLAVDVRDRRSPDHPEEYEPTDLM